MRVTLDRQETQTGLIFKKPNYQLEVTVDYTEEEKAIIRKHRFTDYVLIEFRIGPKDDDLVPTLVGDFIKRPTRTYAFNNLLNSQQFEAELKQKLQGLKSMIESGVVTTGKETFTL